MITGAELGNELSSTEPLCDSSSACAEGTAANATAVVATTTAATTRIGLCPGRPIAISAL